MSGLSNLSSILTKPDWRARYQQHQYVDSGWYMRRATDYVYGQKPISEYTYAHGSNLPAMSLKFLFLYLGGLYYARKQFIPGYMYFLNRHFNYLKASKYLIGGWVLSEVICTFNFGNPILSEDGLRRKFRALHSAPYFETTSLNM